MNSQLAKSSNRLLGIGTDIVYLPRFYKLLQKYPLQYGINGNPTFYKLANKFMHPFEIAKLKTLIADDTHTAAQVCTYVGGVWAVKESVIKALACFVPPHKMPPAQRVYTKLLYKTNDSNNIPIVRLDNKFPLSGSQSCAQFYHEYIETPSTKVLISISHDQDYLVAFACLVKESNT